LHILDVLYAIDWIRREIVHFGGDANQLTLMGHSSAAEMISLLSTSPKINNNTEHFQQAIGMSCARYTLKSNRNLNASLALIDMAKCRFVIHILCIIFSVMILQNHLSALICHQYQ
jgi:carboxylesterase type B